jgi:hypothetical protein
VSTAWISAAALLAAAAAARADEESRLEFAVLPAINYSTDTGVGVGAIGAVADLEPGFTPYRFRIEAQIYTSIKDAPEGGLELVTHSDYVSVDLAGLAEKRLRLRFRVGFDRAINAGYYGLGNAAQPDPGKVSADPRYTEVDLAQTRYEPAARVRLDGPLELFLAARVGYSSVGIYPGSKLDEDRAELDGVEDHGELGATVGVVWSTRDDETWPHRGVLADASVRAGAGLGAPFGYGGATLDWRAFVPLVGELTLGLRAVGDALWGSPPFDELTRFGGLSAGDATGGGSSLRGVPAQRYRGKLKILAGAELRVRSPEWSIGSQRFRLGAVAFVDAGRVWSGLPARPELDGDGLGLTLGLGGGLRVQWGETFVIRADLGYGPREDTTGLYIDVGHVF